MSTSSASRGAPPLLCQSLISAQRQHKRTHPWASSAAVPSPEPSPKLPFFTLLIHQGLFSQQQMLPQPSARDPPKQKQTFPRQQTRPVSSPSTEQLQGAGGTGCSGLLWSCLRKRTGTIMLIFLLFLSLAVVLPYKWPGPDSQSTGPETELHPSFFDPVHDNLGKVKTSPNLHPGKLLPALWPSDAPDPNKRVLFHSN